MESISLQAICNPLDVTSTLTGQETCMLWCCFRNHAMVLVIETTVIAKLICMNISMYIACYCWHTTCHSCTSSSTCFWLLMKCSGNNANFLRWTIAHPGWDSNRHPPDYRVLQSLSYGNETITILGNRLWRYMHVVYKGSHAKYQSCVVNRIHFLLLKLCSWNNRNFLRKMKNTTTPVILEPMCFRKDTKLFYTLFINNNKNPMCIFLYWHVIFHDFFCGFTDGRS